MCVGNSSVNIVFIIATVTKIERALSYKTESMKTPEETADFVQSVAISLDLCSVTR